MKPLIKNLVRCRYYYLFLIAMLTACTKEQAVPIAIDFSIEVINNDYSVPVQLRITNKTVGADTYAWSFEGAKTTTSTNENPGIVVYDKGGDYSIRLTAMNRDGITETKELPLNINAAVVVGFNPVIIKDNFSPMEVALTNTTLGATSYKWTFQNGTPASASAQNPTNVVFTEPGDHLITLEVSNGRETTQIQKTVTVAPHLIAAFEYQLAFDDDDLQAPLSLTMANKSSSATSYIWTCIGGTPATSTETNPKITFASAGTYTLQLVATNGKETKTETKTISILPDTNLRTLSNIELGINTADNANRVGAFYSTQTRQVYTSQNVTETNGSLIDIAFYGLNANFSFNKFISPDEVQNLNFDAIPHASHTQFINKQESCNCGSALSVTAFDQMNGDSLLKALPITETTEGSRDFDSSVLPRIVLFKTQDGRKGAIKIKRFVNDGLNSYLVIDIKLMKHP